MRDLYQLMTRAKISAPAHVNPDRQCRKCREYKPESEYYMCRRESGRQSLTGECKRCLIDRVLRRHRAKRAA